MQIAVLTDSQLSSIAEWQKAIDTEGFPLRLSDAGPNRDLAAQLGDEKTSIEYGVYGFLEFKERYKHVSFRHDWAYAIVFTWSSDFAEEISAWMAATAYARATNGVIFDEQEGKILTPEESSKVARDVEERRPAMEAMFRNYVDQLAAKSPEIKAKLESFLRRRSTKSLS